MTKVFWNCFSGLKCFAPYVADWGLGYALSNPGEELDLKIVEVKYSLNFVSPLPFFFHA